MHRCHDHSVEKPGRYYTIGSGERDRLIAEMRRRGYPMHKIAKRVGMSTSGVCRALERLREAAITQDRDE